LVGLKGKRVAVVGAGISNTPLIYALLNAGVDTRVCDKRSREELGGAADRFEALGAKLVLGLGYLEDLDADVVFRTPGLMPSHPGLRSALKRGAVLTSEMEAFFEVCPCKIIGVTGSDGKTTTTSIIAGILKYEGRTVHVGGNIGTPLLTRADEMKPEDVVVLELSSFQLITMKKCPHIAVVTNLSPNHLDVHADMEEYIGAKRNIFLRQNPSDRVVFNYDDPLTRALSGEAPGEVLLFSSHERVREGVFLDSGSDGGSDGGPGGGAGGGPGGSADGGAGGSPNGGIIYEASGGLAEAIMPAGDILLPGFHNVGNYMAAFAAVRGLAGKEAMAATARSFRGVPHRIELVRTLHGIRYYNDSIATSPSRAIAGLRAFDRKVILIAGGKDKGVGFGELGAEIVARVKTLVLTGMTAESISDAVVNAPGYSGFPEIIRCDDFTDAVISASGAAREGDVVLLSPACTSFDRFKNFEERGDAFRAIVEEMS